MRKFAIFVGSIFIMLSFASTSFSIDTAYDNKISYHQTFVRDAIQRAKAKGMIVQSRDGKQSAIVPKAQKEEKVVEQSVKGK
jgi:hypothetical protein